MGFTRPTKYSRAGNTSRKCAASPASTLKKNQASGTMAAKPVPATTFATRPNTPMGANFITQSVIFMITWNNPFHNLYWLSA